MQHNTLHDTVFGFYFGVLSFWCCKSSSLHIVSRIPCILINEAKCRRKISRRLNVCHASVGICFIKLYLYTCLRNCSYLSNDMN
jgi:hypothetical protein